MNYTYAVHFLHTLHRVEPDLLIIMPDIIVNNYGGGSICTTHLYNFTQAVNNCWGAMFSLYSNTSRDTTIIILDSTKVQTLGAISESINETRHCTAASYDTGQRGVYLSTEPVSRRLAASAGKPDCRSAFPRCAEQLVAKGK